ncbi:MAG: CpaF family protein [Acidimicrobiia bacterium]
MITGTAFEELRQAVIDRIKSGKLDPETDPAAVEAIISEEVGRYQQRAHAGVGGRPLADPDDMERRVRRSVLGYGVLSELLNDQRVEEIFISGNDVSYVDHQGRLANVEDPTSEEELLHLVNRLLQTSGREVNIRNPIVQARVLNGQVRLGVVIPPVADRLSATLRKYTMRNEGLTDLVERDSMSRPAAALLSAAMRTRTGVLVSGIPAAGKTTLVNALMRAVPPSHRVLGCEEVRELSAPLMHGDYYQTRAASIDGSDSEVTLRDLVKICLGMRPDLLVVGEVRGEEAFELTRAGNAGCGVLATVHSNSAREGLQALVSTAIMAGQNVPERQVRSIFSSVFDFVIHCDREDVQFKDEGSGGIRRQVMEIIAIPSLQATDTDFSVEPIFVRESFGAPLRWTGAPLPEDLRRRLDAVLRPLNTSVQRLLEGSAAAVA